MLKLIWSAAQIVFLGILAINGYVPKVYRVDLSFNVSRELRVFADVVFIVDVDDKFLHQVSGGFASGATFGNIVLLDNTLTGELRDALIAHELVHVSQFRALGPWLLAIHVVSPQSLEPRFKLREEHVQILLSLPPEDQISILSRWTTASMWCPPPSWNCWPFLSLYVVPNKPLLWGIGGI